MVTKHNFDQEYLEYDIERQLELESYGYSFLRVNKFSLGPGRGKTKIDVLDTLLEQAFADQTMTSFFLAYRRPSAYYVDNTPAMPLPLRQAHFGGFFYARSLATYKKYLPVFREDFLLSDLSRLSGIRV